ncbi:unnamed protein product [Rhizoctonia solani]|uniref:DUF6533 domain-containing protein n=1 Tax=Rhizoctonia solani TaxID=456999 RepID=A0A8H3DM99_9AGAM|nr:unnamed protein product [Rhizoctonia solani]
MSFTNVLLDLALEAYNNVEVAKKLALVAVTFFAYDMLLTLETEIKYVWSAKWGYGRAAFHFNRIWSILILAVYLPMIFGYDVPIPVSFAFRNDYISGLTPRLYRARCHKVIMFYGYGIILLVFNTSIVMSMRAWVLYDRNPFIATGLALSCIGGRTVIKFSMKADPDRASARVDYRLLNYSAQTNNPCTIPYRALSGHNHILGYLVQGVDVEPQWDQDPVDSLSDARWPDVLRV